MNGALFLATCPIHQRPDVVRIGDAVIPSHWESEPLSSEHQAIEALRAHLNSHAHGDLVDHIVARGLNLVAKYIKTGGDTHGE